MRDFDPDLLFYTTLILTNHLKSPIIQLGLAKARQLLLRDKTW